MALPYRKAQTEQGAARVRTSAIWQLGMFAIGVTLGLLLMAALI